MFSIVLERKSISYLFKVILFNPQTLATLFPMKTKMLFSMVLLVEPGDKTCINTEYYDLNIFFIFTLLHHQHHQNLLRENLHLIESCFGIK